MTKKNSDVNERDVLGKIQRWIKSNNKTTYDLIGELDVFAMPSADLENLTSVPHRHILERQDQVLMDLNQLLPFQDNCYQ